MATCGNCGAEVSRVRSVWDARGRQLPDECPVCSPEAYADFKVKSVRDGTIAMGYEYMPTMYKKTDAGYVAKDELIADTEAQASKPDADAEAAYQAALAKKRANRRTKPLTQSEIEQAISRFNNVQSEAASC